MKAVAIVCLVLLTAASVAAADTLSIPLGPSTSITDGVRSRLLVRPALPASVAGARIDFAMLSVPSLSFPDSLGLVTIDERRVTTSWDPSNVSWTSPWHTPSGGGDYDTTDRSFYGALPGDSVPVRLDLTRSVRAWQADSNFGFILMRPPYEGGGFGREGALLRKAIRKGRVKLWFTKIQN